MRKLTLNDFPVVGNSRENHEFISGIGDNLLRTNQLGKAINSVGHKLKDSQSSYSGMRWTKGCNKLIIINDERQELAKMGERGLLTSSVILEECLQMNRGNQNYEHERNKFHVKDNEVTNRRHLPTNLASLDLLWVMHEQQLDAIEIAQTDAKGSFPTFKSERYKTIVSKYTQEITDIAITYLNEQWKGYEQAMKEQDGGTIDWSKSFRFRDWLCDWSEEHRQSYSSTDGIVQDYNRYMSYDEDNDANGNAVVKKEFSVWVEEHWLATKRFRMEAQSDMLMTHFGFAETTLLDEDNAGLCVQSLHNETFYNDTKLVAVSQFKRNDNWTLHLSNLVRAEAMKLNRLSQEGTFND